MDGRFTRTLGRRHAGGRYHKLQAASIPVDLKRETARDRAILAARRRDFEIRNYDRRSWDMDKAVELDGSVKANHGSSFRIRLPRGQRGSCGHFVRSTSRRGRGSKEG